MKELDLLLETFVLTRNDALEAGQWPRLESLLLTEDDVLWDWLQDRPNAAAPEEFRALIDAIRQHPPEADAASPLH